ncbi:hypothetical protein [Nocardiopsis tropica]|uniref:Uncharacterized protein n=1 Tax=Nocardiopsis tropica TaxID=109330 RepID=A0ABV1ZSB6_9ACTN
MAEFVLAAGAWPGSRAWDGLLPELRPAGHGVPPTAPAGPLGSRGGRAGRSVRAQDVVGGVERPDLRHAVPVGAAPGA